MNFREDMPAFAKTALNLIHTPLLTLDTAAELTKQTVQYWKAHVNEGFLKYRKTMGDGDAAASLDWSDRYPGTAWFNDARDASFLDMLSGFGIFNVGHRHPRVTAAVQAQLLKQPMHSQEFLDPLRAFAARLLCLVMPSRVLTHTFFVNSGTEAVEAALKLAILHTGRSRVVACINAFHGKTLGALAATSKATFREPFLPVLLATTHVVFNAMEELTAVFAASEFTGDRIAAFIVEPVQGEGGVHVATDEYLATARRLCTAHGACLIFDEVQSGFGRTGKWFACEFSGVVPDLLCVGKSAGGGVMPVAACCGSEVMWQKYVANPFLFTSTFGGNPLAMAALIATVNVIEDSKLLLAAECRGRQLKQGLEKLAADFQEIIKEVRGRGLMLAVEFHHNDYGVQWARGLLRRRVLVAGTLISAASIRVCPPLVIKESEIDYALREMREACKEVRAHMCATLHVKAKL